MSETPSKSKYVTTRVVDMDGPDGKPMSVPASTWIELSDEQARPLLKLGAVQRPKDKKKAVTEPLPESVAPLPRTTKKP
jgi:hypothetical protein